MINYIEDLIDTFKDNIEFDSDIVALDHLLRVMAPIDYKRALNIYKEIINSDDFVNKHQDVDYSLMFNSCLLAFLDYQDFDSIIYFINNLKPKNKRLAYFYIFNTFDIHSFINQYIKNIILKSNKIEERKTIELINSQSFHYPKEVFDMTKLLENVINWHIKFKKIDLKLLNYYATLPNNNKDKAILKTMLLDYNLKDKFKVK